MHVRLLLLPLLCILVTLAHAEVQSADAVQSTTRTQAAGTCARAPALRASPTPQTASASQGQSVLADAAAEGDDSEGSNTTLPLPADEGVAGSCSPSYGRAFGTHFAFACLPIIVLIIAIAMAMACRPSWQPLPLHANSVPPRRACCTSTLLLGRRSRQLHVGLQLLQLCATVVALALDRWAIIDGNGKLVTVGLLDPPLSSFDSSSSCLDLPLHSDELLRCISVRAGGGIVLALGIFTAALALLVLALSVQAIHEYWRPVTPRTWTASCLCAVASMGSGALYALPVFLTLWQNRVDCRLELRLGASWYTNLGGAVLALWMSVYVRRSVEDQPDSSSGGSTHKGHTRRGMEGSVVATRASSVFGSPDPDASVVEMQREHLRPSSLPHYSSGRELVSSTLMLTDRSGRGGGGAIEHLPLGMTLADRHAAEVDPHYVPEEEQQAIRLQDALSRQQQQQQRQLDASMPASASHTPHLAMELYSQYFGTGGHTPQPHTGDAASLHYLQAQQPHSSRNSASPTPRAQMAAYWSPHNLQPPSRMSTPRQQQQRQLHPGLPESALTWTSQQPAAVTSIPAGHSSHRYAVPSVDVPSARSAASPRTAFHDSLANSPLTLRHLDASPLPPSSLAPTSASTTARRQQLHIFLPPSPGTSTTSIRRAPPSARSLLAQFSTTPGSAHKV